MFNKSYSSIFEQEDEFGLNNFRDDFYAIFNMNKIQVQLLKPNLNNTQLQNDFMGVRTSSFSSDISIIEVCLQSQSPEKKNQHEEGYNSRGEKRFDCYVPIDIDITEKYTIKLLDDYKLLGLKPNQEFRVELNDFGFWKGQYGFRKFTLIAI